jgi:hypothetical protein
VRPRRCWRAEIAIIKAVPTGFMTEPDVDHAAILAVTIRLRVKFHTREGCFYKNAGINVYVRNVRPKPA